MALVGYTSPQGNIICHHYKVTLIIVSIFNSFEHRDQVVRIKHCLDLGSYLIEIALRYCCICLLLVNACNVL